MNVMKSSLSTKIIIIVSVLLLCGGIAVYSFMRLSSVEQRKDFDLYSLVPQDAVAVFETDRVVDMLGNISQMSCSQDGYFPQISKLFGSLSASLEVLQAEVPHALSKQMNKVLVSFHRLGTLKEEVLYCALGTGDYDLVESFIEKYASSFPIKSFEYKGEKIRIYPMQDGQFLSMYLTQDFLAVSFQEKLLEQVIDARHTKHSLMENSSFKSIYRGKGRNVPSLLYVRMRALPLGAEGDSIRATVNLSEWMEFDLKFSEEAIYASGISYETDTVQGFVHALQKQQETTGYAGDWLPASTFWYECRPLPAERLGEALDGLPCPPLPDSLILAQRSHAFHAFMEHNADGRLLVCSFLPDSSEAPCTVVAMPLKDERKARQRFHAWLNATPRRVDEPRPPRFNPDYERYPRSQSYRKYLLPRTLLWGRWTGHAEASLYSYACFYRGRLLWAADARSLSAYIDAMEKKALLQDQPLYQSLTHTLASSYRFLMVADLEPLSSLPNAYSRLLPTFFLQHADFFRHFLLALQFTCTEGIMYPNVTLLYKEEINRSLHL